VGWGRYRKYYFNYLYRLALSVLLVPVGGEQGVKKGDVKEEIRI
jgi:hypothetical protein